MLRVILIFILATALYTYGISQNVTGDPATAMESVIEVMQENQNLPEDLQDLQDNLNYYRENPLNLNTASREDLEKFFFLTGFQIQSLLDYRQNQGPILTLYELPLIYGFDSSTVSYLLPYVKVDETEEHKTLTINNIIKYGRNEVVCNLTGNCIKNTDTTEALELSEKYYGAPYRVMIKYRYHYQQFIRFGLTMEKDAGEDFFRGSNPYGFDFYSGYLEVKSKGFLKSCIIGDYQVNNGQGLTIWTGYSFGKTPYPALLYKRPETVKPYSSSDENRFLRGIALSFTFSKITLSAFYSLKALDANITDTIAPKRYIFSSFQETGYHRTFAEIADEDAVTEQTAGGMVIYRSNRLRIGSSFVHYLYNGYKQKPDEPYKNYEFYGNRLTSAGIDYSYLSKKYQLYGEASWSNHALATINGIILNVNYRLLFTLLYRYYDPAFYSRYSDAISENTRPVNENAFYLGTVLKALRQLKITAYADFFSFPWLTYLVQKPSPGYETMIQADFNAQNNLSFYIRMLTKSKTINYLPEGSHLMHSQMQQITSLRFQVNWILQKNFQLRNRMEYKSVNHQFSSDSKGFLMYQDIMFRFNRLPVQLYLRFLMFSTSGYASRLYCFENDLLYAYTAPAFYDEGYRSYFLLSYHAFKSLDFRLKVGYTSIENTLSNSSENGRTSNNQKLEYKIQLRMLF